MCCHRGQRTCGLYLEGACFFRPARMGKTRRGIISVAAALAILCACVLATPVQPRRVLSTGFCASPAIGSLRNVRVSCLSAPALPLLASRARTRLCVIRAQENRGKDAELSKDARTILGGVAVEQTREEVLRDKLARCSQPPSSFSVGLPDYSQVDILGS